MFLDQLVQPARVVLEAVRLLLLLAGGEGSLAVPESGGRGEPGGGAAPTPAGAVHVLQRGGGRPCQHDLTAGVAVHQGGGRHVERGVAPPEQRRDGGDVGQWLPGRQAVQLNNVYPALKTNLT